MIPKHPDPDALKRFREVPYQLRYGKEEAETKLKEMEGKSDVL